MFSQIVMVHFKLKLKLTEKGLVPKQIDLFQIQLETECVQSSVFRVSVQGDLSSLAVPHIGGTSSAWGTVESGALTPCGCLTQTPGTCRGKSELKSEAACTLNTQGKMSAELKGVWFRTWARGGNYTALCKMRLSLGASHSSRRLQWLLLPLHNCMSHVHSDQGSKSAKQFHCAVLPVSSPMAGAGQVMWGRTNVVSLPVLLPSHTSAGLNGAEVAFP